MGRLYPEAFPLCELRNESERRVVEALLDYTDDGWIIMPSVRIGIEPPVEVDVVVAHPEHGFAVVEVKGWTNPTYEVVVVATDQWPAYEAVLYVALSRAVHALIVCGPRALGDRLGL